MLPAVRRGILGGTFDPPHWAHLVAGEVAYRQLGLDVVMFLPAGEPWQKSGTSPAPHRLAMVVAATENISYFDVDDREVYRDGPTYTIETLEEIEDDVTLILGADAASRLPTWHRWEEVLGRAQIAVVPRRRTEAEATTEQLPDGAEMLDMPFLDLSGTEIRARVSEGRPIRFMVPDPVWRYVDEHGLYV